ncbi:MAG: phosphonate C-P lyase system protein PhnH [Burkholderiaceae bacterium]|nr:phosphonate C-P lyase system protein PhnH [Burkholderiaceae bacterium]
MTTALDIAQIGAGFEAPSFDSQRVFRTTLQAMARPGTLHTIDASARWPRSLHPAAGAVLLALLDQDTRVWLSRPGDSDAVEFLRFHTGCVMVDSPAQSDFACVIEAAELPAWTSFACGTDEYPHRSTTVLIQLTSLQHGYQWTCSGPGIDGTDTTRISLQGMPRDFGDVWNAQRRMFPCGVDTYFVAGHQLLALPRTTNLQLTGVRD